MAMTAMKRQIRGFLLASFSIVGCWVDQTSNIHIKYDIFDSYQLWEGPMIDTSFSAKRMSNCYGKDGRGHFVSPSSSHSTSSPSSSPTWHNGKILRLFLLDHHFCRGLLLLWAGDRNVELVRGKEIIPYFQKWNTFLAGCQQSIPHQVTFGHPVGSHRQVLRIQRECFPAFWRERKLGINFTSLQMKE